MRILNRPMFKYGGPIKEGVMHGMRDGGRTIAGGHQIGMPMGNRTGFADPTNPGFWQKLGAQYKPKNLFKWSRLNPFKKLKTLSKVPKIVEKGIPKNLQGIFTQTGTSPGVTGSGAAQQFLKNLGSFPGASKALGWAKKAKDVAFKYPKSTAAGVLYGGVPLASNLPYKKIASTIADVAVPDQIYNWETGRWFNSDDTDLKPSDKKILEEKKTEIITERGVPGGGDKSMTYTDPDAAKKLAQQKQNERLKSYLDMMGYDSAKKGALSDALIDASALVQDATTEAGSIKHADWGNLINRAIQTTSKRLDKPEQIREAVGLMATKAAIQKDLEDPQVKKLRALQIEDAEEKLNAGFEKDMSEFIFGSKTAPDKAQLKRYARLKADEHGLNFTIITDEVIDKIPKDATEKERMEQAGIVDDGIYMIGSEIIRVKDGKIKQIA